jgi:hypothetical protein
MSIFNSKDKDLKAKVCSEPCEGCPNTRTSDIPQKTSIPETRDGRLTKITIEHPDGKVNVIEAHGFAISGIRDLGDKYEGSVGIFGTVNTAEMMELHDQVKDKLLTEIEKALVKRAAEKYSLNDLVSALAKALGEEE